ncbi:hypothetical protein F3Y22_tig00015100pilonHSYRG00010 [Hibiscus syriacus]|uniref:Reverse transcriptase zinc-binding domain-containing protein n=1 Tax=Hibiscus syriacus TaxID=106335 RepID=A0A6A3BYZ0_HIBSY|nr:hypothetical protein F3Y22_tig00015100pilonHSYRG00010 [Hibiscus syriacus]
MPASIASELNKVVAKFIWNSTDGRKIHWVCWEQLCLPRQFGGLGLVDFKVKIKALLYKWFWRLFGTRVGDDSSLEFWSDNWVNGLSLKNMFPRIFALAVKKAGKVADFGQWVDGIWQWKIQLRRAIFDWEVGIWENFSQTLKGCSLGIIPSDCLRWTLSSSGLIPHDIELFASKVLINRVPTKNGKVFNNEKWDGSMAIDRVWLFLGWWSKANWPDLSFSVNEFIRDPKIWSLAVLFVSSIPRSIWIPPVKGGGGN